MITTGIYVTNNAHGILFTMNDYASIIGFQKFFREKTTIVTVQLRTNWIEYTTIDGKSFSIANALLPDYPNVLWVEKVDGVNPTSLSDLFDKLLATLA